MSLQNKTIHIITISLTFFLVKCDRNPFGNYDNSLSDPDFHPGTPEAKTNTTVNKTIYAFVTNIGNSTVTKCTINSNDGSLYDCSTLIGTASFGITPPWGIAYSNQYLYIFHSTGGSSTTYALCTIDSTSGSTSSCLGKTYTIAGSTRAMGPVIFDGKAYLPNFNGSQVIVCSIDSSDASLTSCNTTATTLNGPHGIFLTSTYAYIANYQGQNISLCNFNSSAGTFSGCAITGRAYGTQIAGIEIYNNNAYVTLQQAGSIDMCSVNPSTGQVNSSCTTALNTGLAGPNCIKILNGYAYITNYLAPVGSGLTKCKVSTSDGSFSNCVSTGSNFNQPTWMTFSN